MYYEMFDWSLIIGFFAFEKQEFVSISDRISKLYLSVIQ